MRQGKESEGASKQQRGKRSGQVVADEVEKVLVHGWVQVNIAMT